MTISAYLVVPDARAALAWYAEVFGAVRHGDPVEIPDGRIGHAELVLDDSLLMLADPHPEIGVTAPAEINDVTLHLTVPDVDALVDLASARGAVVVRPPEDAPYGRTSVLRDPFGHRWMIQTPQQTRPRALPRSGEVAYVTKSVADLDRAKAFYAAVLGWRFDPGSSGEGAEVAGVSPMIGLWGGWGRNEVQLCYSVDDVAAACERVRAAGGTAQQPQLQPYGWLASCTDDQGVEFQLWAPAR